MNKEQSLKIIQKLTDQFAEHIDAYKKSSYDEAQVRIDFINNFFKALGWDIDNENGLAEAYREVIYEDRTRIKGKLKSPDYGFRLKGQGEKRLFFVEAKKPSVSIKTNKEASYQLRRYGRSAQTPVSILTNFEDFVIYDCTQRTSLSDTASTARLKIINFKQYVSEFDFLWDTFSYEGVEKGRFDKYVTSDTLRRGHSTLDKDFVESLETWRKELATTIAKNNHQLTEDDINFAVQLTIDRLIFLRFCEDRVIEDYGNLKHAAEKGDVYKNLLKIFKVADDKYNSGIFDFERDFITPKLSLDNKVIKNIVDDLYGEYEFSMMPVEILGNAYEQFLGKVIRITPGHIAKIEEKPEVRKAGGVYYTPQYIVDYIVENTVGKLIADKTPKEIEKLKICDPACGSGSFLLGAYQYLLNYHMGWYYELQKKGAKLKGELTPDGRLSTEEKKKILTNNIFGVDLDANAVEVSKLSLLLKCMEGETASSVNHQVKLLHQRVLPNIDKNIVCGNSLIGWDFFDAELNLNKEERKILEKKIKPFDWQLAFPKVFKQGGFDAVIGNPPYIPLELINENEKNYYKINFKELTRKYESSVLFILNSFKLINKTGLMGCISTQTWQTGENYIDFRKKLFKDYGLIKIINLPFNIFKDAYVDTGIFIFSKNKQNNYQFYSYHKKVTLNKIEKIPFEKININKITAPDYKLILNHSSIDIASKFTSNKFIPLGEISISTQGLSASRFSVSKNIKSQWNLPFTIAVIKRYSLKKESEFIVDLVKQQSLYKFYLEQDKILIRRIINRQNRIDATFFSQSGVFKKDANPFIILDKTLNTKFILGIINSRLFSWLYINTSSIATKDDFRQTTLSELRKLPIKKINFKNKTEKSLHDKIVSQVETMLELNKELQETPNNEQLKNRIAYTDRKIDELVYELYGMTKEEIEIIEKSIYEK